MPERAWPSRLEVWRAPAACRATLRELGVDRADISALAADAATQWTGTFNPRPFDARRRASTVRAAF